MEPPDLSGFFFSILQIAVDHVSEVRACDGRSHLSGLLWLWGCATALRALRALLPDVFTDEDKLCV